MTTLVDIVNKDDGVIGRCSLEEKDTHGYITRNVIVFIQDFDGRYVVCKRDTSKSVDPGLYDASVCGNVESGETYEVAAHRELREELGFDCELTHLDTFYNEFSWKTTRRRHFTGAFYGRSSEHINLNSELTNYQKLSFSELNRLSSENSDTFSIAFLNEFKHVAAELPQS